MNPSLLAMQNQQDPTALATEQLQAALELQNREQMDYAPEVDEGVQLGGPASGGGPALGTGGINAASLGDLSGKALGGMFGQNRQAAAVNQTNQIMQDVKGEAEFNLKSVKQTEELVNARMEYEDDMRRNMQANSRRFKGGPLALAEDVFDMFRSKSTHKKAQASKERLIQAEYDQAMLERQARGQDAKTVVRAQNPNADEKVVQAIANQYALSPKMSIKDLYMMAEEADGGSGRKPADYRGIRSEAREIFGPYTDRVEFAQDIINYAQGGQPMSDLALITSYRKFLDPTSVVRESEGRAVEISGSLPDTIKQTILKWTNGAKLTPSQRRYIVEAVIGRMPEMNTVFDRNMAQFEQVIQEGKYNPKRVPLPQRYDIPDMVNLDFQTKTEEGATPELKPEPGTPASLEDLRARVKAKLKEGKQ